MPEHTIAIDAVTGTPATIVDDAGTGRLAADAKVRVATGVRGVAGGAIKIDKWTPNQDVGDTAFVDVYLKAGPVLFHKAVFQLQRKEFFLVVEVDGAPIWPANDPAGIGLEEIDGPFALDQALRGAEFPIRAYKSKRILLWPAVPLLVNTELKIKLKSESGTRKVLRGMTVWGEQ